MADWQVGDLAVCVDDGPNRLPWGRPALKLRAGSVYKVSAVFRYGRRANLLVNGEPHHGPYPDGTPSGWAENRFRKIRPDEHEACEPEFVTLLKRSKRKVAA